LLMTKLYMPPPSPRLTPRPHLIRRLEEGLRPDQRLTLISAPAGFGKTTLWSARRSPPLSVPPSLGNVMTRRRERHRWSLCEPDERLQHQSPVTTVHLKPAKILKPVEVAVEGGARPPQEVGQFVGRIGPAAAVLPSPAQAQDAGHGDDQRVIHVGAGDGRRELDIAVNFRPFRAAERVHSPLKLASTNP